MNLLELQEELATEFKYKRLPTAKSQEMRQLYRDELPPGIDFNGCRTPLYTKDGTLVARGYQRVVIGDYGAFLEIEPQDFIIKEVTVKPGEEYRLKDSKYAHNVKYLWYTAKDKSNIKIYYQLREVLYADYRVGMFYISPYEVEIQGEPMKNEVTVCFTGHRPSKLGGYDWMTEKNLNIMRALRKEIVTLIKIKSVNRFIFGGAIGIDQMAFAVALKLKREKYPEIRLIIAVPFRNQFVKWNKKDQDKYSKYLQDADEVVYVDELEGTRYYCTLAGIGNYHRDKMQIRNEYMVDQSDFVIAVWDGTSGGTANCVRYAIEKNFEFNKNLIQLKP